MSFYEHAILMIKNQRIVLFKPMSMGLQKNFNVFFSVHFYIDPKIIVMKFVTNTIVEEKQKPFFIIFNLFRKTIFQ